MTVSSVADKLSLGWDAIDRIKQRAVARGLSRRRKVVVKHLGIDETSYQKGHDYVTVLLNKDDGTVLAVLDGRDAKSVTEWFQDQKVADFSHLKSVSTETQFPRYERILP